MCWQQVRPFSAQLDTMLNATFCSTGTGNIMIPTSHRGPGSNLRPRVSGQLTPTSPTFTMLCFPSVQGSLCQASHRGWTSWLVIQGKHSIGGAGKDMKCNSACFSFLTLPDHLHSPAVFTPVPWAHTPDSVGKWPISLAELLCLVFGIRSKIENMLSHCRCIRDPVWAMMSCSWERITRGFHSDLCTLAWPRNLKEGLRWPPILTVGSPHRQWGGFGAHSHSVLYYVGSFWDMANTKTTQKGHFHWKSISYLNLGGEITYKQAVDVIPDGGKILWHVERLLLPKIHSLLSRIQPFH